jgi:hypothetical protein
MTCVAAKEETVRRTALTANVLVLVALGVPAWASDAQKHVRCLTVHDEAHDEAPPPEAVGFDRGSLDVLGLRLSADARNLRAVISVRSLGQPVQPPGQSISYFVEWTTEPHAEQAAAAFTLDAELDGGNGDFALVMRSLGAGNSDVQTQVGGRMHGVVDVVRRTVTVDVPRSLLAPYGPRFDDITVSSWHGVGNPSVAVSGQEAVGSSGYRRIADSASASHNLDLRATLCPH